MLVTQRMTPSAAHQAIADSSDGRYGVLLEHGTLELGCYAPRGSDPQQPHEQDEVYIVLSGHGLFELEGKTRPFETGEALFVPAGARHRFVDFSDDFAAWVVFYGPTGGERP
jgi:mannose-6-phosphate isomerase-like protein (cupin superfamily)